MSRPVPALLVSGDPRHGVVRLSRQLAEAVAGALGRPVAVGAPAEHGALHVHFTDRLWGATPAQAADAITRLADGRRLTVTLHDLPQASDGEQRLPARRACYRQVLGACAGAVCNSEHERALLHEAGIAGEDRTTVIALPVIAPVRPAPPDSVRDEVAMLGFVYPGKGHGEAIRAVAGLPAPRPAVRALGMASAGHDAELARLHGLAARLGVDFAASGWLEDDALAARMAAARVPLAAHRHVSASGSVHSWIAAGRIPLVADSRYARELDRLRPHTIRRYPPAQLGPAIAAARSDDRLTRRAPGVDTRPHLDDVAARYLQWWDRS